MCRALFEVRDLALVPISVGATAVGTSAEVNNKFGDLLFNCST